MQKQREDYEKSLQTTHQLSARMDANLIVSTHTLWLHAWPNEGAIYTKQQFEHVIECARKEFSTVNKMFLQWQMKSSFK